MYSDEENLLSSPKNNATHHTGLSGTLANNGENHPGKRPATSEQLKLVVKRPVGNVDDFYFDKLLTELVGLQRQIPLDDPQPRFHGSGHTCGIAWFHAVDDASLDWLKASLAIVKETGIVSDFIILPYSPIPQLRRVSLSIPFVSRLKRTGPTFVLQTIGKLNKNLNTAFWKVLKMSAPENGKQLVIMANDEQSISVIEQQSNKIFFLLSKTYVKVYPKTKQA